MRQSPHFFFIKTLFEKIDFSGNHTFALPFLFSFEITENLIYHLFLANLSSVIRLFVCYFCLWGCQLESCKGTIRRVPGLLKELNSLRICILTSRKILTYFIFIFIFLQNESRLTKENYEIKRINKPIYTVGILEINYSI